MSRLRLRPSVRWFAEQMELKLRENDHKGGWEHESWPNLVGLLHREVRELEYRLFPLSDNDLEQVILEAADIANFSMMIADKAKKRVNPSIPVANREGEARRFA